MTIARSTLSAPINITNFSGLENYRLCAPCAEIVILLCGGDTLESLRLERAWQTKLIL
jgi:hypothetical protein